MLEEMPDGSFKYMDMTSILLNQEKYRRLLGDMDASEQEYSEHSCRQVDDDISLD